MPTRTNTRECTLEETTEQLYGLQTHALGKLYALETEGARCCIGEEKLAFNRKAFTARRPINQLKSRPR